MMMGLFKCKVENDIETMNLNEKKAFKKGIVLGVLCTVCGILLAGNISMAYRMIFKKEINYTRKAREIYSILKNDYVEDFTKEDLYDGIYYGMVGNVADKYSRYFSKEDYEEFEVHTNGNYVGIGVGIGFDENENIIITNVYEDSPAQKSGLQEGDRLLKVDGTEYSKENYDTLTDAVRGKEGTDVVLTIYRNGQTLDVTVTRQKVDIPTVASAMLKGSNDENIGYIMISGFEGVTSGQFEQAYNSLTEEGMQALVIDLRNNPGGLLTSVSDIADMLIPKGVITYTEDKKGKKDYVYSKDGEIEVPLAVLVNGNSASASELLSAAVQDTGKGVIVGTNTYGKGVVQSTIRLADGSAVKVTTAKYYTPNGICIDGVGVKPDIEVELNPDYVLPDVISKTASYDTQLDNQLAEGIKAVEDKINKN
jgi:carboxyl-terminal processing protease